MQLFSFSTVLTKYSQRLFEKKMMYKYEYLLFSACNKTYTGDIGGWYSISIPRPRGDMLPFSCFLTFTTPISQDVSNTRVVINLDQIRLGRFLGHTSTNGCPDGHLHISEGKAGTEPPAGSGTGSGLFCGVKDNSTREAK